MGSPCFSHMGLPRDVSVPTGIPWEFIVLPREIHISTMGLPSFICYYGTSMCRIYIFLSWDSHGTSVFQWEFHGRFSAPMGNPYFSHGNTMGL